MKPSVFKSIIGFALFAIALLCFTPISAESVVLATVLPVSTTVTTNVEAIAKYVGPYSKTLFGQMLNSLDVIKDLFPYRSLEARKGILLPKIIIAKGAQPLDTNKTKRGGTERTVTGRKLYAYDCMKLFNWVPDEWVDSFASDMLQPGAKQIPFAQYVLQKEFEKMGQEINDNFYFNQYKADAAAFGAADTYTASNKTVVFFPGDRNWYQVVTNTSAGESPATHAAKWKLVNDVVQYDGIGTIIGAEITAGTLVPIVTGAISSTNAMEKVELMYRSMTEPHRNRRGTFWMSWTTYEKYLDNYRNKYPALEGHEVGNKTHYVFGSGNRWVIKPATWMAGSNRIIIDMEQNLRVGTNLTGNPGITNTVPHLHGLDGVAKWLFGSQISDLEVLYVNDQA